MTRTENERLAVVESDVRHLTIRHEEFRVEVRAKHEEFRQEVRDEFRSVRGDVASVRDEVAEIKAILTRAQGGWMAVTGGWRTLVAVGGFIGGLVAAAHWLWNWLAPLVASLPR